MVRPRDNQKSKVYKWEHTFGLDTTIELSQAERFIKEACTDYACWRTPKVVDGRGTRVARGSAARISLPRWARTPVVVIHELSHAFQPTTTAHHGPEFMRIFIELLARYTPRSKTELLKSARAAKIKVAPAANFLRKPVRPAVHGKRALGLTSKRQTITIVVEDKGDQSWQAPAAHARPAQA